MGRLSKRVEANEWLAWRNRIAIMHKPLDDDSAVRSQYRRTFAECVNTADDCIGCEFTADLFERTQLESSLSWSHE
jgi:hypothetical protein